MTSVSPETIAAVDLGSNSFHMIVARTAGDEFRVIDRIREVVRLAAGLDADNNLTPKAVNRAIACLEQFGERIRDLPPGAVRIVGTNTLRKARNSWGFIRRAEAALGHPVDIISGHEEARLIYLGVAHGLDDEAAQRLVMDIGGGSTEFIVGRRFEPAYTESVHLGCVSHSGRFFADGKVTKEAVRAAELAARQELEHFELGLKQLGWQSVIGASGTILAVREIVIEQGWSREGITPESLRSLTDAMLEARHVDKLSLKGLSDERRGVLPGGVAILSAAFEALGIERMLVSDRALREGVLYDLLGRIHQEDVRERTIADLATRYHTDEAQAARVRDTALALLDQVAADWSLPVDEARRMLHWAAAVHEIGLSVSHSQYHKHGAYLLRYHDMPGFSRGEQKRVAALVRGHRRKVPMADLARLPDEHRPTVLKLSILLRLATLLHRRRSEEPLPEIRLTVDAQVLRLAFPEGWLGEHPLTLADLESEAGYLRAADYKLKFR
ncbi:MAG: exopolyphosphatase [Gammaproteobacteria bacterium]